MFIKCTLHDWRVFGTALLLAMSRVTAFAQGAGAFTTAFNAEASGYDSTNAYLLSYLATIIYPEHLARLDGKHNNTGYISNLHRNSNAFFEKEFARLTRPLFSEPIAPTTARSGLRTGSKTVPVLTDSYPQYRFVADSKPAGYDPEAMVIATEKALFVVFRGTDRVASNPTGSLQYEWNEWLLVDFDFRFVSPDSGLRGRVHAGFWSSLLDIREGLLDALNELDPGKGKKLWITGHSLGAAHAQLFAAYVAQRGRTAQGVYVYAAPHVGDQIFVADLEALYGGRLQRFDFVADPVTMVPPYTAGYERAGIRNYHDDLDSLQRNAPERPPPGGGGAGGSPLRGRRAGVLGPAQQEQFGKDSLRSQGSQ